MFQIFTFNKSCFCNILYKIPYKNSSNIFSLPKYTGSLFELKNDKENINEKISFKLVDKQYISHNTFLAKFELPNNNYLGCPLGHHIYIHSNIIGPNKQTKILEQMSKRYTPISPIIARGYFSLLVKVYRPNQTYPSGGVVSQYIDKFNLNDNVLVSGPVGKMEYLGEGEMLLKDEKNSWTPHKYKNICFIAAGTGIAPIYQLLQASYLNKDKKVNFSLIYANKSDEDILLDKEIDEIFESKEIILNYLKVVKELKNKEKGFRGCIGEITKENLIDYLPKPGKDTLIMLCGRKDKSKLKIIPLLKNLGYKDEEIFMF